MHVAFVGGRAPVTPERRGAIEKLTVEYAVALVERGHSATIFTVGEALLSRTSPTASRSR